MVFCLVIDIIFSFFIYGITVKSFFYVSNSSELAVGLLLSVLFFVTTLALLGRVFATVPTKANNGGLFVKTKLLMPAIFVPWGKVTEVRVHNYPSGVLVLLSFLPFSTEWAVKGILHVKLVQESSGQFLSDIDGFIFFLNKIGQGNKLVLVQRTML